ncbi:hypothetical protein Tco_0278995, partial [Tanacetum coccineum]
MMMCKQAEQGVPLQAEKADWLERTRMKRLINRNWKHITVSWQRFRRQHSENNTAECADERVALANLIANLTLDTEENKMILKQLNKTNASL